MDSHLILRFAVYQRGGFIPSCSQTSRIKNLVLILIRFSNKSHLGFLKTNIGHMRKNKILYLITVLKLFFTFVNLI